MEVTIGILKGHSGQGSWPTQSLCESVTQSTNKPDFSAFSSIPRLREVWLGQVTGYLLAAGFQIKINLFSHYLDIFIWCDENNIEVIELLF